MDYDYFLIMKFLISGISILALTQIIFDVLEAKHKSEKRRKMFQRILWQGSPIVLGMATLGLFYWRKKILAGRYSENGNNSSRFQVLDAKNRVLDQRYHRGGLDRAGVKISELDTPCPMGDCRSEVWKEPIILQNAQLNFSGCTGEPIAGTASSIITPGTFTVPLTGFWKPSAWR